MIKTLIFDLGGVFIKVDPQRSLSCLQREFKNVSEDKVWDIFDRSELKLQYDCGFIDSRVFYEGIKASLGIEFSYDYFHELWSMIFSPIQPMIDLLPSLINRYQVVLLSNTNELHIEYCREHYPFLRLFHHLIFSYEVGCIKPGEEIFRIALERSDSASGECVFVDDTLKNVQAASALGMKAFHFIGYESLYREWERQGILQ